MRHRGGRISKLPPDETGLRRPHRPSQDQDRDRDRMLLLVFDSDGDTDPDTDAGRKGSRPGSSTFHIAAGRFVAGPDPDPVRVEVSTNATPTPIARGCWNAHDRFAQDAKTPRPDEGGIRPPLRLCVSQFVFFVPFVVQRTSDL
jgi:hypothetical protein